MGLNDVREAYGSRASEYVDLLGRIENTTDVDRALILNWARSLDGDLLDVGCGPGHWTDYLRAAAVSIEGIDPVPEFIESARSTYPNTSYRLGSAAALDVPNGSISGILSWYSLIHTAPIEIDAILSEFARSIRPGGGLALGFFAGPKLVPFEHAGTTAYFWPIEQLAARVTDAGFEITHTETRKESGARQHAALLATRVP